MVKRAHEERDNQFLSQSVQNKIFQIFQMFKSNMKLTKAACWTNSKNSNWENSTTLMIFLCY